MASSVTVGVGGGGEKGKGGGGEMDGGRKMSLSRQHAKDISEYTRQLLTKDRELESLRIRLAKVSAPYPFSSVSWESGVSYPPLHSLCFTEACVQWNL